MFVVAYAEGSWVKLNLLLKTLVILGRQQTQHSYSKRLGLGVEARRKKKPENISVQELDSS